MQNVITCFSVWKSRLALSIKVFP